MQEAATFEAGGETVVEEEYAVREFCLDGVPYRGKTTKAYGFVAYRRGSERRPGVLLLHGGGAKAFRQWALQWAKAGYVAMAVDLFGQGAGGLRLSDGGPALNYRAEVARLERGTLKERWCYQSVATALRAMTALREQPNVDPERIGVVGISWGGYLAAILTGIDERVRSAVIVYGAGNLEHSGVLAKELAKLSAAKRRLWRENFDPASYVAAIDVPTLWANGTADESFPLEPWCRTVAVTGGTKTARLMFRWPHEHLTPWATPELIGFADQTLKGIPSLAAIRDARVEGENVRARYDGARAIVSATLYSSKDGKRWTTSDAVIDEVEGEVWACPPSGSRLVFLSLCDEGGGELTTELLRR